MSEGSFGCTPFFFFQFWIFLIDSFELSFAPFSDFLGQAESYGSEFFYGRLHMAARIFENSCFWP